MPLPPIPERDWEEYQASRFLRRPGSAAVADALENAPYQPGANLVAPSPLLGAAGASTPSQPLGAEGPGPAPAPPPAPASRGPAQVVGQFDDPGISYADAVALCGPAAAASFARAYGRTPSLAESRQMAIDLGVWDRNTGMYGPDAQKRLLEGMGVPVRHEYGTDWARIAQEVQAGNPVLIDTPQHYYTLAGYNPETGKFYVGGSGTAYKGGAEWLGPNDMARLSGTPRSSFFTEGLDSPTPSRALTWNTELPPIDKTSPDAFLRTAAPYAQAVEAETGIPAHIMLGIAANETGYGRAVAGNNFFGIKGSNPRTGANTGQVGTWEVVNGQRVNTQDTFRAYDDPADSFRDFAEFLASNARYKDALTKTQDPEAFIRAVHQAGYATDPNWSNQVLSIAAKAGVEPSPRPFARPSATGTTAGTPPVPPDQLVNTLQPNGVDLSIFGPLGQERLGRAQARLQKLSEDYGIQMPGTRPLQQYQPPQGPAPLDYGALNQQMAGQVAAMAPQTRPQPPSSSFPTMEEYVAARTPAPPVEPEPSHLTDFLAMKEGMAPPAPPIDYSHSSRADDYYGPTAINTQAPEPVYGPPAPPPPTISDIPGRIAQWARQTPAGQAIAQGNVGEIAQMAASAVGLNPNQDRAEAALRGGMRANPALGVMGSAASLAAAATGVRNPMELLEQDQRLAETYTTPIAHDTAVTLRNQGIPVSPADEQRLDRALSAMLSPASLSSIGLGGEVAGARLATEAGLTAASGGAMFGAGKLAELMGGDETAQMLAEAAGGFLPGVASGVLVAARQRAQRAGQQLTNENVEDWVRQVYQESTDSRVRAEIEQTIAGNTPPASQSGVNWTPGGEAGSVRTEPTPILEGASVRPLEVLAAAERPSVTGNRAVGALPEPVAGVPPANRVIPLGEAQVQPPAPGSTIPSGARSTPEPLQLGAGSVAANQLDELAEQAWRNGQETQAAAYRQSARALREQGSRDIPRDIPGISQGYPSDAPGAPEPAALPDLGRNARRQVEAGQGVLFSGLPGGTGSTAARAGIGAAQGAALGAGLTPGLAELEGREPTREDYVRNVLLGAATGGLYGAARRRTPGTRLLSGIDPGAREIDPRDIVPAKVPGQPAVRGELIRTPMEAKPNLPVYQRWAQEKPGQVRYLPEKGGFALSNRLPKSDGEVRDILKEIELQPRIPFSQLGNPQMDEFLTRVFQNKERIARGEITPEAMVVSQLLTVGSIRRGASSFTKALEAVGPTAGPELAHRTGVDIQQITGAAIGQTKGVVIRPEMLWAMISSDTANPTMMKMLAAIARPNAFPDEALREQAIEAGVSQLYEVAKRAGHGDLKNPDAILGRMTVRKGEEVGEGGRAWKDTIPQTWEEVQSWARNEGRWAEMTPEQAREAFPEFARSVSPRGIGTTKSNFWPAMFTNPELATLDGRMLNDGFGLADNTVFSQKEYQYLVDKIHASVGNAFRYGSQWLPWEFMGGEHTTYNALADMYDQVSDYFLRAERMASETGRPLGEVLDDLSAGVERVNVELGDPQQVVSRIGVSADAIQNLPAGATRAQVEAAVPELKNLMAQAGVDWVDTVSAGKGYWVGEGGQVFDEIDLDVAVKGTKSAVEWLAAAMGKSWTNHEGLSQEAVMVAHFGQGPTPTASVTLSAKNRDLLQDIADLAKEHFGGWHVGLKRKGEEANLFLAGVDGDGNPWDAREFEDAISDLAHTAQRYGAQVSGLTIDGADVRFLGRGDYDDIIRSGPKARRNAEGLRAGPRPEGTHQPGPDSAGAGGRLPGDGGLPVGEGLPGAGERALGAVAGAGAGASLTEERDEEGRLRVNQSSMGPAMVAALLGAIGGPAAVRALKKNRAGNILLDKYLDPDLQQIIAGAANAHPQWAEDARRGVLPDEVIRDLSKYSGINVDEIARRWKPGQAANAETVLALRNALADQAQKVGQARAAYNREARGSDDAGLARLAEELLRHQALQEVVHGVTAEAGRALRQFRQNPEAFRDPTARLQGVMKMMRQQGRSKEEIASFLAGWDGDWEKPEDISRLARTLYHPSLRDYFDWYWYNSLLSSPVGRVRDAVSSTLATLAAPIETAAALPFDVAASLKTGQRSVYAAEVPAQLLGMRMALSDAGRQWATVVKDGFAATQVRNELEFLSREPVAGMLPNLPSRLVAANDAFFKAINRNGSIYAQAVNQAQREKLSGARYAERVAELRTNPTQAMVEQAMEFGQRQTWQQRDPFSNWLSQGKRLPGPLGLAFTVVLPFHQTPINLVKYAAERSPFGYGLLAWNMARGKGTQRGGAELMAKATLGTAAMAGAWQMAQSEDLTADAPRTEAERDAFYRQGKQPYSVRLGDTWYSYQNTPMAPVLAAAAQGQEAIRKGRYGEGFAVAGGALFGMVRAMGDMPFMQGFARLFEAYEDPSKGGPQFMESLARSAVPQVIQFVARANDPIVRDVEGPGEALQSALPGLSTQLPSRLNAFGEDVSRPEGVRGLQALNPFRPSKAVNDPVEAELKRLHLDVEGYRVQPGTVTRSVRVTVNAGDTKVPETVKLKRDEERYLQMGSGSLAYVWLHQLVNSPQWNDRGTDDFERRKLVNQVFTEARERYRDQLQAVTGPRAIEQTRRKLQSGEGLE